MKFCLTSCAFGCARALGHRKLGARRFERGLALGHLRAQMRGIELGDRLAGSDTVAFAHQHAFDLCRQLRPYGRL